MRASLESIAWIGFHATCIQHDDVTRRIAFLRGLTPLGAALSISMGVQCWDDILRNRNDVAEILLHLVDGEVARTPRGALYQDIFSLLQHPGATPHVHDDVMRLLHHDAWGTEEDGVRTALHLASWLLIPPEYNTLQQRSVNALRCDLQLRHTSDVIWPAIMKLDIPGALSARLLVDPFGELRGLMTSYREAALKQAVNDDVM